MIADNYWTYEKEYEVRYSDMDYNQVLKPSAMLNFLQDLATVAAESLNFGYSFVSSHNYAWFLLKYHMEFEKYPEKLNDLIIKTEARGFNKLFANRDFEIYSQSGEILGRIISLWSLIDLDNKSMLNVKSVFDKMIPFEKRETDLSYEKFKPLERVDFKEIFKIRFDDIDVNFHVNNVNYIVWAMEALPYDFKSKHKLKTLDMVYKKEIKYGHNIISQVQFDESTLTSIHVLKNQTNNDELCLIKAQFV